MYCRYCGSEIGENDKFCRNCGQRTSELEETNALVPVEEEQYGTLYVKRRKNSWYGTIPVDIYIDGVAEDSIKNGEVVEFEIIVGEHEVLLLQQGHQVAAYMVNINADYPEEISFEISSISRSVDDNVSARRSMPSSNIGFQPPPSGKICPRCGGYMMFQTVSESRKSGCGTILLYVLLAITIFGLLIVIPLALRKKTETVTYAVCQNCGYKRQISRT